MATPANSWEAIRFQNLMERNTGEGFMQPRTPPPLPPLPRSSPMSSSGHNSYLPVSSGYNSYGNGGYGYSSYGSYGMPYRSSLFNTYGGYGGYNNYGNYGMFGPGGHPGFPTDDAERRFIQYAEESSRNTFASVESIVRTFNSIAMMLDNTFFALTSSFRAVLGVAENFGNLRTMFGHIWYSISIFRLFNWLYRKLIWLLGGRIHRNDVVSAWRQAAHDAPAPSPPHGPHWPTLAFLGILASAPYIISKFLPKYEDKSNPATWKSPGVRAKAVFDFIPRSSAELNLKTNDEVTLAPTYIQEGMQLRNSGWAFAIANGKSGLIPLNHVMFDKSMNVSANNHSLSVPVNTGSLTFPPNNEAVPSTSRTTLQPTNNGIISKSVNDKISSASKANEDVPTSRVFNESHPTPKKRVSFGENQIFENVDLEDYITGKKEIKGTNNSPKIDKEEKQNVNKINKTNVKGVNEIKNDEIKSAEQ